MRFLLVYRTTLRIASQARDGLYRFRRIRGQAAAEEYLRRFLKNRSSMERLELLLRERQPDLSEDPLSEDQILSQTAQLIDHEHLLVAEQLYRPHPITALDQPDPAPTPPPPKPPKSLTWIELQFFNDRTGAPVPNLRVVVRNPDGNQNFQTTDSDGLIRIEDIQPGTCDAWCEIKGAKLADTLAYAGDGPPAQSAPDDKPASGPTLWHFLQVDRHQVKTGQTLESIAKAVPLTWQELAKFNWGTDVPDKINEKLRDEVGCTRKTKDGQNYIFDDSDHPGILFIPKKWEKEGLATGQRHIFRGRGLKRFFVILENDELLRIPQAIWEANLADDTSVSGQLGVGGVDAIEDPPDGDVEVFFPDIDDIEAKSLAASARKAFDDRDPTEIHRLFRYPIPTIQRAFQMYDQYFNTYHKNGLREDIKQEFFADPEAEQVFWGYLQYLDAPPPPPDSDDALFVMEASE